MFIRGISASAAQFEEQIELIARCVAEGDYGIRECPDSKPPSLLKIEKVAILKNEGYPFTLLAADKVIPQIQELFSTFVQQNILHLSPALFERIVALPLCEPNKLNETITQLALVRLEQAEHSLTELRTKESRERQCCRKLEEEREKLDAQLQELNAQIKELEEKEQNGLKQNEELLQKLDLNDNILQMQLKEIQLDTGALRQAALEYTFQADGDTPPPEHLAQTLAQLRQSGEECDALLIGSDGQQVPVHSLFFAQTSLAAALKPVRNKESELLDGSLDQPDLPTAHVALSGALLRAFIDHYYAIPLCSKLSLYELLDLYAAVETSGDEEFREELFQLFEKIVHTLPSQAIAKLHVLAVQRQLHRLATLAWEPLFSSFQISNTPAVPSLRYLLLALSERPPLDRVILLVQQAYPLVTYLQEEKSKRYLRQQLQETQKDPFLRTLFLFLASDGAPTEETQEAREAFFLEAQGRAEQDEEEPLLLWLLGRCHEYGIGTPVDQQQALSWYEKATRGGNAAARSLLFGYLRRQGTSEQLPLALHMLRQAADGGDAWACARIASTCLGHPHGPLPWSIQEYSALFEQLVLEKQERAAAAFHYASLGSQQGCACALLLLAECFERGVGTQLDLKKAESHYQKASDRGSAPASLYLARQRKKERRLQASKELFIRATHLGDGTEAREELWKLTQEMALEQCASPAYYSNVLLIPNPHASFDMIDDESGLQVTHSSHYSLRSLAQQEPGPYPRMREPYNDPQLHLPQQELGPYPTRIEELYNNPQQNQFLILDINRGAFIHEGTDPEFLELEQQLRRSLEDGYRTTTQAPPQDPTGHPHDHDEKTME